MRHPFRDAGERAIRLRDNNKINATIGESPKNRHHLAATRMKRIRDPHLNRLLAGSLSLFRTKLESRGYPPLDRVGGLRTNAEAHAVSRASGSRLLRRFRRRPDEAGAS